MTFIMVHFVANGDFGGDLEGDLRREVANILMYFVICQVVVLVLLVV